MPKLLADAGNNFNSFNVRFAFMVDDAESDSVTFPCYRTPDAVNAILFITHIKQILLLSTFSLSPMSAKNRNSIFYKHNINVQIIQWLCPPVYSYFFFTYLSLYLCHAFKFKFNWNIMFVDNDTISIRTQNALQTIQCELYATRALTTIPNMEYGSYYDTMYKHVILRRLRLHSNAFYRNELN